MKRLVALVGGAAAVVGAGYVFYQYGLSDQDRQSLHDMADAARSLFEEARSLIEPVAAQTERSSEAERIANREDTRRQWEELGY